MPRSKSNAWFVECAEIIRSLPKQWDFRTGMEFDDLPSDERARIQRARLRCLSLCGKLLIEAILDKGWLDGCQFADLRDSAEWGRKTEHEKPYAQGATQFLGMFLQWAFDNRGMLPAGLPEPPLLNCHSGTFRPEEVSSHSITKTFEAIATIILATAPAASGAPASVDFDWARQCELVRATNRVLGEAELQKGRLSRACSAGEVETNGRSGAASRANVSSFLVWVKVNFEIGADEVTQIQDAVMGEIRLGNSSRNS